MRQIKIKTKDLIFTRITKINEKTISELRGLPRTQYWDKLPAIVVLKHPAKKAYLIYNGNHRAFVAKTKNLKANALLVETEKDLSKIPPSETMFYSYPKYYRKLETAIKRLIQKSKICRKKHRRLR